MVPEGPLPPNTILLTGMMRELSATPGFTDALLAQLNGNKQGPALMTPALVKRLRELILGKDWQGLDRFPGWTLRAVNPTVKMAGKFVAKKADGSTEVQPEGGASAQAPLEAGAITTERVKPYLDLGPYTLEKAEVKSTGPAAIEEVFADVSRDRLTAARKTLALVESGAVAPEALQAAARRLIFLKGNDSHDYKFSSAVLEDYANVSPAWRDRYLASGLFHFRTPAEADTGVLKRTRAALRA